MPFFGTLACGAAEAAIEKNYRVLISNAEGSEQAELDAIDSLVQHHCNAIVFHSQHCSDEVLVTLAEKISGLVFINRFIAEIPHRCIWLDNNLGAQKASSFLLEKGHTNFAVITRKDSNPDSLLRLEGIHTALNNANIQLDNSMIEYGATADMKGGKEAVSALFKKDKKFTALLVYNDNMAIGAVHELNARGIRVPEDISVIGFDDMLISVACIPQLTTMHYPVREMAQFATKLAIELSTNPEPKGRTHLFMPHLIERDSVANFCAK